MCSFEAARSGENQDIVDLDDNGNFIGLVGSVCSVLIVTFEAARTFSVCAFEAVPTFSFDAFVRTFSLGSFEAARIINL